MKKILTDLFATTICIAVLSGCSSNIQQESETLPEIATAKNDNVVSETTTTAEIESETAAETTEPELEINYQKKRAVTYPIDGDSYISYEYEYGDNNCLKETVYNSAGEITAICEYEDDILVKSSLYYQKMLISIDEYDKSKLHNITKIRQYSSDNGELICDMIFTYQFNDDNTESVETCKIIYYTGEQHEVSQTTCKYYYDYDEKGNLIRQHDFWEDHSEETKIMTDISYKYDDNNNKIEENHGIYIIKYEYNENNDLISEKTEWNNQESISNNYEIKYEYDEYDRQIGWTNYDSNGNETLHTVVEYE